MNQLTFLYFLENYRKLMYENFLNPDEWEVTIIIVGDKINVKLELRYEKFNQ